MSTYLWLTWFMRVIASGNLTVELIRAQRFDVVHRLHTMDPHPEPFHDSDPHQQDDQHCRVDRVELSPQAIACDPWAMPTDRADHLVAPAMVTENEPVPDEQAIEPGRISPVVGSPALAGLGAAWVVPGTLLDVVA